MHAATVEPLYNGQLGPAIMREVFPLHVYGGNNVLALRIILVP